MFDAVSLSGKIDGSTALTAARTKPDNLATTTVYGDFTGPNRTELLRALLAAQRVHLHQA